jgi:hypothetical protein
LSETLLRRRLPLDDDKRFYRGLIMQRLLLLMGPEQPPGLEAGLSLMAKQLTEIAASIDGRLRLAVQLEGDPLTTAAPGAQRSIKSLQGLVDVTIPGNDPRDLLEIVAALVEQLDTVVDWSRSAVSIGQVRQILPAASDTLLVTLAANRLPTIDRAAFHAYWLNVHAALAMSMLDDKCKAAMGYQQVHADDAASLQATALAGAGSSTFDGVLQVNLARIDDLPHLTVPGFAEAILKDEENFADHSAQMLGGILRMLHPGGEQR